VGFLPGLGLCYSHHLGSFIHFGLNFLEFLTTLSFCILFHFLSGSHLSGGGYILFCLFLLRDFLPATLGNFLFISVCRSLSWDLSAPVPAALRSCWRFSWSVLCMGAASLVLCISMELPAWAWEVPALHFHSSAWVSAPWHLHVSHTHCCTLGLCTWVLLHGGPASATSLPVPAFLLRFMGAPPDFWVCSAGAPGSHSSAPYTVAAGCT